MREKLIELLDEAEEWADRKCDKLECENCPADKMKGNCVQQLMVDRLIAHGVTVQQWIPVTERLPDKSQSVLGYDHDKGRDIFWYGANGFNIVDECGNTYPTKALTHWMPLPEPPKGE